MKNDKSLKKKNLIVLDIGTNSTKVVVGKYANNKINAKKLFSIDTPFNCLSNGQITDFDKLINSLSKGLKDNNVKKGYVVVNFKSSSIINRELDFPSVDDKELSKMVRYEILQFLPVNETKYVTQYKVVEDYFDEKIKHVKVSVTAIDKSIVESYLELVKQMGLKPYALDVHFNTLGKFFLLNKDFDLNQTITKSVAVIDLGYNSTDVSIFLKNNFKMNKTLDTGSKVLEKMLASEFKSDMNENILTSDVRKNSEVTLRQRVEEILDPVIDEIRKVLMFYISRDSLNTIDHIYITGGLSHVKGMCEYLEKIVSIPVYTIKNIDKVVDYSDSKVDLEKYINAFGALVRL